MGRERARAVTTAVVNRQTGAYKHKRKGKYIDRDRAPAAASATLSARPVAPKLKYQSYFEFQENTDKKKKLEFQVTNDKEPKPGFTFVPVGNPELTNLCKEISREEDALIFVVSGTQEKNHALVDHVHRIGYHFRSYIVDQAALSLGGVHASADGDGIVLNETDAIPETQEEINKQSDAAIRDLFPRIPNTDREQIIQHAFQKGASFHGKSVVGLQDGLSLSRRVQLAVIAHIRHNHTRYDHLLRETDYRTARRTVEGLCLDILLKWRGDEETGRDQLDEVLREVVVISDSESDDSEDADSADDQTAMVMEPTTEPTTSSVPGPRHHRQQSQGTAAGGIASRTRSKSDKVKPGLGRRKNRKKTRRQLAWEKARQRQRDEATAPKTSTEQLVLPDFRDERDINARQHTTRHHAIAQPENQRYPSPTNYVIVDNRDQLVPREQFHSSQIVSDFSPQVYANRLSAQNRPDPRYPEQAVPFDVRDRAAQRADQFASSRRPFNTRPETTVGLHHGLQDTPLPSIEQPTSLLPSSSTVNRYPVAATTQENVPRHQVMYALRDVDRDMPHPATHRPNIVYVADHEADPNYRRSDAVYHATSEARGGQFVRVLSKEEVDRRTIPTRSWTHIAGSKPREHIEIRGQLVPVFDEIPQRHGGPIPQPEVQPRVRRHDQMPPSSMREHHSITRPMLSSSSRADELFYTRGRVQEPVYLENVRPDTHVRLTKHSERLVGGDREHVRGPFPQDYRVNSPTFPNHSPFEMKDLSSSITQPSYPVHASRSQQQDSRRVAGHQQLGIGISEPRILHERLYRDLPSRPPYRQEELDQRHVLTEDTRDRAHRVYTRQEQRNTDGDPIYVSTAPRAGDIIVIE